MANKPAIARDAVGAFGVALGLITLGELVGDGSFGLLVGIIAFGLIVYAMTRVPVRNSMLGLLFFATVLPNPSEGQPTPWAPPFSTTGQALLSHLNTLDRSGILGVIPVSTMEIFFLVLFLLILHRKSTKSKIDGEVIPTPKPLIKLAQVSLAATGFTWGLGLASGGDFAMSLWQVNAVIYLPIIFLLMQASLRGPKDHWAIAKLYLIAAAYKCALAFFVVNTIELPGEHPWERRPAYGTAHADSMLFSLGFLIVIAPLLEGVDRRWRKLAVLMLPILALGTIANNRRLAWLQVGVVLFVVFLVSRESNLKRNIRRVALASVPLAIGYVMAGWESKYGGFFKPVRIIRSVVDTEADGTGSSQWREFENFNIIATFHQSPLFGSGYGHPYKELIPMPAVAYSLEPYIPHNSLLGLWAYAGALGFAGLTLLWVVGIYFAMRAYHASSEPSDRATAIVCFGALPIYLAQCWGDLGLSAWNGIFMMGTAFAVAGKLAVARGQWPMPAHRR
ncbi:MAG: hypothetical protein JWN04_4604 [Myxococcaceae bacterium]|nr:hypothetical protein [Myxococcaceae bacterium]